MAEVEENPFEPTTEEEEVEVEVEEEEEVFVPGSSAVEIKLFGKWSFDDIEIRDISLVVRAFLQHYHVHVPLAAIISIPRLSLYNANIQISLFSITISLSKTMPSYPQ